MDSRELYSELEKSYLKISELEELIDDEKRKNYDLNQTLKLSLQFKTTDTLQILSDLISIKEHETYGPLVYNKKTDYVNFRKVAFAISKIFNNRNAMNRFKKQLKYRDKSSDYILIYYNAWCLCNSELTRLEYMTFISLLHDYDLMDVNTSEVICDNDFDNYPYVNDFIEYLFDLQVQKGGKHLTYKEMQVALSDYLELEKNKPKQRIKEINN